MSKLVYDVQQVSHVYRKGKISVTANDGITLDIREGEIVGVLGPNGAGKSTLIKQLVGQLRPTSGRILFGGYEAARHTRMIAALVAYYAQEPHVLSSLRVMDALVFTGRLRGMETREAIRQADDLLERFGMTEHRSKLLKQLSGGQKRMVGIGTTLIGHAPVLILDEPTNELDPVKRRLVWSLIQERNQEGATVILVTHNVLEAEQVVGKVAVVNRGKLLAWDLVSRLKNQVDKRLKFDVTANYGKRAEVERVLRPWGQVQVIGEHRMRMLIEKPMASRLLDFILDARPDLPIEDYAVTPPSLEDVYFHVDQAAAQPAEEEAIAR